MTDLAVKKTAMKPWTPYLRTLRRIPRHIILDLARRHLDENSSQTCICGWAARGALADSGQPGYLATVFSMSGASITTLALSSFRMTYEICQAQFGGTLAEWRAVYFGAAALRYGRLECAREEAAQVAVETALAIRVAECSAGRP